LGTVPWAGGTETAEGNWREGSQIHNGETPSMASAGRLVPADALSCFLLSVLLLKGLYGFDNSHGYNSQL
jgi:hypothetical protein